VTGLLLGSPGNISTNVKDYDDVKVTVGANPQATIPPVSG
jgi:hypothetical protein